MAAVVDSMFARQKGYDPDTGLEALVVAPIAQAQADQRAGRAGRERPGVCARLCTEAAFQGLAIAPAPEVARSDLAGLVLQLKVWGREWVERTR